MRNCEVIIKRNAKPVSAKFHQWVTEAYVIEPSIMIGGSNGGQVMHLCALVELENGQMKFVDPTSVRFTDKDDKPKLFIKKNDDKEKAEKIAKAVKDNNGYCPCELTHTLDTKCICRAFRDQDTPGPCHCGLYIKYYK